MYWDPNKRLLLIVYVDDMKLAGPAEHLEDGWKRVGKYLGLEVPKGDEDPNECTFLGCTTTFSEIATENHGTVKVATQSVEHALRKAIDKYVGAVKEATGLEPSL